MAIWTWQQLAFGLVPDSVLELIQPLAALVITVAIPTGSNMMVLIISIVLHILMHVLFGWSIKNTATCKYNKVKQESSFSIIKFIWNTAKTYIMMAYWINYVSLDMVP